MWVSESLAIDSVVVQVKSASGLKDSADGDGTGEQMGDHRVPQDHDPSESTVVATLAASICRPAVVGRPASGGHGRRFPSVTAG